MKTEIINATQEDFLAWSGGFPPESEDQITVYIDYAMQQDSDAEEVRVMLRSWMNSGQRTAESTRTQ